MEMAKVTSKGQITIPISIRKRLNIKEGDKILFLDRAEGVLMLNPDMLGTEAAETTFSVNAAVEAATVTAKAVQAEQLYNASEESQEGVVKDREESYKQLAPSKATAAVVSDVIPAATPVTVPATNAVSAPAAASVPPASAIHVTAAAPFVTAPAASVAVTTAARAATVPATPAATAQESKKSNDETVVSNAKKPVEDLNLSTLLDEIRSFNTKI